jgi:hypothetical protein
MQSMTFVLLALSVAAYLPQSSMVEQPPSVQLADLRSFFHGEPSPQPKALPPKRVATVSTAARITVDGQIESFLRAFADALMARDAKALLPRLSPKYTVDNLPSGKKAIAIFQQAVEQLPGPSEIIVKSIERNGDVRTVKVDFRFDPDNIKTKIMRFDANGLLLWSDLFRLNTQPMAS